MGPLSPEAEGIEQLIVDALHDLADASHPPPQALGPGLAAVALGWVDDARSVEIEPPPMVFLAFEALVGYVGSRADRAHADKLGVRSGSHGEEGLRHLLVGSGSSSEAKACNDPAGIDGSEQAKSFVPAQAIAPADVGAPGQPSMPATLAVPDGHRRAIQGLVRVFSCFQKSHQMQDESLDELCAGAHTAVELRAIGQGREGLEQISLSVAIDVPFAGEPRLPSEDSQSEGLALGKGCLRTGPSFWRLGVAEVVDHDVECSEEGVLKSTMRSRFLSLRDRVASRL
jgi:hypothetical protein